VAFQAATMPAATAQEPAPPSVELPDQPNLTRFFSLKHEFQSGWYRFLRPADADKAHVLKMDLAVERFPFQFRGRAINVSQVKLFLKTADGILYADNALTIHVNTIAASFARSGSPVNNISFAPIPNLTLPSVPVQITLTVQEADLANLSGSGNDTWWQTVTINGVNRIRLRPEAIDDIWVVCDYSVVPR
jgi:hypothetical protein